VPAGNGDRDLQPVVQHRARADHCCPCVHEPPPRRVAVALHPRQPDTVPVSRHVERVGLAYVGDPGALRGRRDHPGPPGQPLPSRDRQVHLRSSPEYQLAAFGEPDDLARRGTHMRGHRASLGSGTGDGHPRIRGWRGRLVLRLAQLARRRALPWVATRKGRAGTGGGTRGPGVTRYRSQAEPGVSSEPALAPVAANPEKGPPVLRELGSLGHGTITPGTRFTVALRSL
jgi:hypothetical protein